MEAEAIIEAERDNARRLRAALIILRNSINPTNGDDHLHAIIGPPSAQLTVGDVVEGALALDAAMVRE
jgi:hypothetical protein